MRIISPPIIVFNNCYLDCIVEKIDVLFYGECIEQIAVFDIRVLTNMVV